MVAIVDYDAGNVMSVKKAVSYLGYEARLTSDISELKRADHVILPGVGAFGSAMASLKALALEDALKDVCSLGIPFLGICLGLQLLFDESEESADKKGLSILKGRIKRIPAAENLSVPHMGWNSITPQNDSRLFYGIDDGEYVYFVHSYYLEASDEGDVAATTEYGVHIHAAVEHGNIFAAQFHPEKSGEVGLRILKNFLEI